MNRFVRTAAVVLLIVLGGFGLLGVVHHDHPAGRPGLGGHRTQGLDHLRTMKGANADIYGSRLTRGRSIGGPAWGRSRIGA